MEKRRRKRRKPEQIVSLLKQGEAMLAAKQPFAQVLQELEISEPTWHRWKAEFGGMKAEEAKRLQALEAENAKLKRLLAEAHLEKDMLKELAKGNW